MTYALQMIAAHPWYVVADDLAEVHDRQQQTAATPAGEELQQCQHCQNFRWQNQEDGQGYCAAKATVEQSNRLSGSVNIEHPIMYANDNACEDFYPHG